MRILFVSDFLLVPYGGAQNSARAHINTLRSIVGENSVDIAAIQFSDEESEKYILLPSINGRFKVIINEIKGNTAFISEKCNRIVYKLLDSNKYNVLFLDNSWFGKIAKYCKKHHPEIRIITYFHGVKHNSRLQYIKRKPYNPILYLDFLSAVYNERYVVKYSDSLLLLNERENKMLEKYYGHSADLYLPVYFPDKMKSHAASEDINHTFNILFVGGALPANKNGIKWFVSNVVPYLNGNFTLSIVGNTMDSLKNEIELNDNILAIGRVDFLDDYYENANVVIGPIFEGDGMKTKTAEALMYGKVFVGTDEALCGYEGLDEYRCNSAVEFINMINKLIEINIPKYSEKMRKIYEKNHSMEMAKKVIERALFVL